MNTTIKKRTIGLLAGTLALCCSVAGAHGGVDDEAKHAAERKAAAGATVGKSVTEQNRSTGIMNGPQDEFLKAVKFDQKLNAQVPLDASFREDGGKTVSLKNVLNGKPVLLVPIYYKCATNCTVVLQETVRSMKEISFTTGQEYDLVALSIDARETPQIAREEKTKLIADYQRAGAEKGWHFLTGSDAQIRRVTDSIGFKFKYDPKTDQFAHPDGFVVLTPNGKVARYFYGISYPSRDMKFALMEAATERIGSPVEQLLLTCFNYDPITNKYSVAIMSVVRMAFVLTVLLGLGAIGLSVWRERHGKKPTLGASA